MYVYLKTTQFSEFRLNSRKSAYSGKVLFSYFFRTDNKKGLGISAKSLIYNAYLVGDASFELATPAV